MHSANCAGQCLSETGLRIRLPAKQDFEVMVPRCSWIYWSRSCHLVHRPQLTVWVCLFYACWLEHPQPAARPVQEDDLPVSDAHARRYVDPGWYRSRAATEPKKQLLGNVFSGAQQHNLGDLFHDLWHRRISNLLHSALSNALLGVISTISSTIRGSGRSKLFFPTRTRRILTSSIFCFWIRESRRGRNSSTCSGAILVYQTSSITANIRRVAWHEITRTLFETEKHNSARSQVGQLHFLLAQVSRCGSPAWWQWCSRRERSLKRRASVERWSRRKGCEMKTKHARTTNPHTTVFKNSMEKPSFQKETTQVEVLGRCIAPPAFFVCFGQRETFQPLQLHFVSNNNTVLDARTTMRVNNGNKFNKDCSWSASQHLWSIWTSNVDLFSSSHANLLASCRILHLGFESMAMPMNQWLGATKNTKTMWTKETQSWLSSRVIALWPNKNNKIKPERWNCFGETTQPDKITFEGQRMDCTADRFHCSK